MAARFARERRTGAATNAFGVNTAATAAGLSVVTARAKSGRPEALIPAASPPARKPAGRLARRSTGGRSVGDTGWDVADRVAVIAGDPTKSSLIEMISGDEPEMPPRTRPFMSESLE